MCEEHTQLAIREEWGLATTSCEPTDIEPIDEYMKRFEEYR